MTAFDVAAHAPGLQLAGNTHEVVVGLLRRTFDRFMATGSKSPLLGPPVLQADQEARTQYGKSFPTLGGHVCSSNGTAAGLSLVPAACHHVFTLWGRRPPGAATQQVVESWCFRNEGGSELGRLFSFRQREVVFVGTPDECMHWRDDATGRMTRWFEHLGLDLSPEPATDPFTGTGAKMLQFAQLHRALKFEFQADIAPGMRRALASSNHHRDHFASAFELGPDRHTACAGFGFERAVLAMFNVHGEELRAWPARLRSDVTP